MPVTVRDLCNAKAGVRRRSRVTLIGDSKMKSLSTKLILSALGVALLATPAFAAKHHPASYQGLQNSAAGTPAPTTDVGTYPNGATRSGSAYSRESGADDNVVRSIPSGVN